MRDERNTDPLSIYSSRDEQDPMNFDSPDDRELRALFQKWSVPERPASLDARITESYRQQINPLEERQEVFMKHCPTDRKSTRLNSSHVKISYAVFCLKK